MIYKNVEEAAADCRAWQKVLLLQDWEIVVKIVREGQMSKGGQAEVVYSADKKQAILRLLDPVDYDNADFPQDHEKSLVHELCHLHLTAVDVVMGGNKLLETSLEVAVDSLARALVRVKRGFFIDGGPLCSTKMV